MVSCAVNCYVGWHGHAGGVCLAASFFGLTDLSDLFRRGVPTPNDFANELRTA